MDWLFCWYLQNTFNAHASIPLVSFESHLPEYLFLIMLQCCVVCFLCLFTQKVMEKSDDEQYLQTSVPSVIRKGLSGLND